MTDDEIAALRLEYPTLLTTSSTIDEDIPSSWLPAIRRMLTEYARIQTGTLYHGQGTVDLHVRGIVIRMPRRGWERPGLLDVVLHAPHARGGIKKSLSWPLWSAQAMIEKTQAEQGKTGGKGS